MCERDFMCVYAYIHMCISMCVRETVLVVELHQTCMCVREFMYVYTCIHVCMSK